MKPVNEIMHMFCKPSASDRINFCRKPFVRDGWKIATNGHIFIRVPTTDANTPNIEFPGAIFFDQAVKVDPIEWPKTPLIEMVTDKYPTVCPGCFGEGHQIASVCSMCEGSCIDSEGEDCEWCNGIGLQYSPPPCPTCNGTGKRYMRVVSGAFIDHHYERWIETLPSVRVVGVIPSKTKHEWLTGVIFTFDGGEGAIMGIDTKDMKL